MNSSDTGSQVRQLNPLSTEFASLRDKVLGVWTSRVLLEVKGATKVSEPTLTDTLPVFYDDIAQALTPEYPRDYATAETNVADAHGRERAGFTPYALSDIIHEMHIFRDAIFCVAEDNNLKLGHWERTIINISIDEAIRISAAAFSLKQQELSQFLIASISHDLRNPLQVAVGAAHLIQRKSKESDTQALAVKIVDKMLEANGMIESILDSALRQNAAKRHLEIDSFDMLVLANDVCADLTLLGHRCEVTGKSVCGFWNRSMMKRALENLLSNAQKHGDVAAPISINVATIDSRVLVSIHNEGISIPADELSRLFIAFERLEKTAVKGWGLGLPFVQHVVENHQGSVVVDSAAARGTTFTINIPIDCRVDAQ